MILTGLRELQQRFRATVFEMFPTAQFARAGSQVTLPYDLVKADHSTVVARIPFSPMRLTLNESDQVSTVMEEVIEFFKRATRGMKSPRVEISGVYVEYAREHDVLSDNILRFDFALWSYDGELLTSYQFSSTTPDEYPIYRLDTYVSKVSYQQHRLLKTAPYEIKLWKQNIAEQAPKDTSVLPFVLELQEQFSDSIAEATRELRRIETIARVADAAKEMLRSDPDGACKIISTVLLTEVTLEKDSPFTERVGQCFLIDGRWIETKFLFQYMVLRANTEDV